jgi:hypothetical protein
VTDGDAACEPSSLDEMLRDARARVDEYGRSCDDASIRRGIALYSAIRENADVGSTTWFQAAEMCIIANVIRFNGSGDPSALIQALDAEAAALASGDLDPTVKAALIHHGSGAALAGCEHMVWDENILKERIQKQRQAIDMYPETHGFRWRVEWRLALMLNLLMRRTQERDPIDESVAILERLQDAGLGDWEVKNALAFALVQRYQNFAELPLSDLETAIEIRETYLATMTEGTDEWVHALDDLVGARGTRCHDVPEYEGDRPWIEAALRRVLESDTAKRSITLTATAARSMGWQAMAFSPSAPDYESAAWAAEIGLSRFERYIAANGPQGARTWLDAMQGLAAEGCYALARMGKPRRALEILERGTGILRNIWLPELSILVPADDSNYRDALLAYLDAKEDGPAQNGASRGFIDAREHLSVMGERDGYVFSLSEGSDQPILYVLSTEIGGMAILCLGEEVETFTLADFNGQRIRELASRIRPLSNVDKMPRAAGAQRPCHDELEWDMATTRGGGLAPAAPVVRDIVAWLRERLSPVIRRLDSALPRIRVVGGDIPLGCTVRVIPVGAVAWLPISAALATWDESTYPVTIASSARALRLLESQARRINGPGVLTITSPSLVVDGVEWPKLSGAEADGHHLASAYGAEWLHDQAATRTALSSALNRPDGWQAVHIAAHGELDRTSSDASRFYIATEGSSEGDPFHLSEIASQSFTARLVFLASCWLGQGDTHLPDEAIGFPAALLKSGALSVIAPLWPVNDWGANRFVILFYDLWLRHAHPAAEALAIATRTMAAQGGSDWAAFAYYGV